MAGTQDESDTASLQAGARIGRRYLLVRALGAGTYGEVWLAEDERNPHRVVAIKFLRAALADAGQQQRFDAEAVTMELLPAHTNIVRSFERGEWKGRRYLVMEYVPGPCLADWLDTFRVRKEHPPLSVIWPLFGQICRALAVAHNYPSPPGPIVHRDLKPANIMIRKNAVDDLSAQLVDFGIAELAGVSRQSSDAILGTPGYMAPEQLNGRGDGLRPSSDVFALGVLLVELLTLDTRDSEGVPIHAAIRLAPRDLVARLQPLRPEIPKPVWQVIARALQPEPTERFPTADALAAALDAARLQAAKSPTLRLRPTRSRWFRPMPALLVLALMSLLFRHGYRLLSAYPPRVTPGGLVVLFPFSWRTLGGGLPKSEQALCHAIEGSGVPTVCAISPPWIGANRWHAQLRQQDAALVVSWEPPGRLLLQPQVEQAFAIGAISLPSGWADREHAGAVRSQIARVLGRLTNYIAALDGTAQSVPPPLPYVPREQVGEDLVVLAAFVRYLQYGTVPPDNVGLTDPELLQLKEISAACQGYGTNRPWHCEIASFLYPLRCDCREAAGMLAAVKLSNKAPSRLRNIIREQTAARLCSAGLLLSAARLLIEIATTEKGICDRAFLAPTATCIELAPGAHALPADIQQELRRLAAVTAADLAPCRAQSAMVALSGKGYWQMRAQRWQQALQDLEDALRCVKHPSLLVNRAECLLHLPGRQAEVLEALPVADLQGIGNQQKAKVLFMRWVVARLPFDAGALRVVYDKLPPEQAVLQDSDGSLSQIFCRDRSTCDIYRILVAPKLADSAQRLAALLQDPPATSPR